MITELTVKTATIEAPVYTWMAVHGNLVLSLKHLSMRRAFGNNEPSAAWIRSMILTIEKLLTKSGAFSADELELFVRDRRAHIGTIPGE